MKQCFSADETRPICLLLKLTVYDRNNRLAKDLRLETAVDIEHYTIADGDILGLVGNNGAGKTTLFRLILDLVKADQGTVAIAGTDVTRTEDWKDITGAYIDDGFLIDYLTPEEYFYFIGRMYGLKRMTWTNASAPSTAS